MSKYFTLSLTIVALVIGVIGGYALSGTSGVTDASMSEATSTYTDQQFLSDMIMHHKDAVEMANRVLTHTSRKEVRDLATNIIEVQAKEITQMEAWVQEWK